MATQLTSTKIQAAATDRGPARRAWDKIRAGVAEMNYASRRLVELQTTGR
jgi:hypothetical protein